MPHIDGKAFLRAHNALVVRLHTVSFWVALVGTLVALANVLFGLQLDAGKFQAAVTLIASLVIGTGIAVHGTSGAVATAEASAPAAPAPTQTKAGA